MPPSAIFSRRSYLPTACNTGLVISVIAEVSTPGSLGVVWGDKGFRAVRPAPTAHRFLKQLYLASGRQGCQKLGIASATVKEEFEPQRDRGTEKQKERKRGSKEEPARGPNFLLFSLILASLCLCVCYENYLMRPD